MPLIVLAALISLALMGLILFIEALVFLARIAIHIIGWLTR